MQRILAIAMILAVVGGGGYLAYLQLVPAPVDSDEIVYATRPVERGDITVAVVVSGQLNPSRGGGLQVPGSPMGGGGGGSYSIEEVLVKEGDSIQQGEVVMRLSAAELEAKVRTLESQLQSERESLAQLVGIPVGQLDRIDPSRGITLRAPISGRVTDLTIREGQETRQGEIVARVVDDSRFLMTAKLTPAEVKWVKTGDTVKLSFAQYAGWVDATITDINPEAIPEAAADLKDSVSYGQSGDGYQFVHWVMIEGENVGLIRPGMLARVGVDREGSVTHTRYYAEVDGHAGEELVLSGAAAIVTRVHVRNMQSVEAGDQLITLAGEDSRNLIQEHLNRIRERETELASVRAQLGQLDVIAPMDGVVAYLEAAVGQQVHPGQWLGSIYNTADMLMWVQVDDIDVLLINPGSPVTVTVTALPDHKFEGEVMDVSTMGRDHSGVARFHVSIRVHGGPDLRPGMQAEARIEAGSAENVLLVPLEAVFEQDGEPRVEVLDPDGSVRVVAVRLGLMDHRQAEVRSGLDEGDEVVVGSTADLLPSLRIRSGDTVLPGRPGN